MAFYFLKSNTEGIYIRILQSKANCNIKWIKLISERQLLYVFSRKCFPNFIWIYKIMYVIQQGNRSEGEQREERGAGGDKGESRA